MKLLRFPKKRYRWVKLRECGKLLHGNMFPLKLKGAVYLNYERPMILNECEEWCLNANRMGILQKTEKSMMRAMCGVQIKDRK